MFDATRLAVRRVILALATAAALCGGPGAAMAEAPQVIRGTTVSIAPPEGFVPAPSFSGFAGKDGISSLMVTELPIEAYDKISGMFASADAARTALAERGITVTTLEQVPSAAGSIPLITGTQTVGSQVFKKWLTVAKGDKTVLITFQAPEKGTLDTAGVKAALATLSLGKEPSVTEKVASLPFNITTAAPFRVVNTIAGSAVILTAGDRDVDPEGTQPLIVVASQISAPIPPDQRKGVARALLDTAPGLQNAKVENESPVTFAGSEGLLMTGTATDGRKFSQYLSFGPEGRFVRLIAIVPPAQEASTKGALETIAKSITFKS